MWLAQRKSACFTLTIILALCLRHKTIYRNVSSYALLTKDGIFVLLARLPSRWEGRGSPLGQLFSVGCLSRSRAGEAWQDR